MKKAVIAYVPVLHEGYRAFFERHASDGDLFVFGNEIISRFAHLSKEIRQLDPDLVRASVEAWGLFDNVTVLDMATLTRIVEEKRLIVMPREDVALRLWQEVFPRNEVVLDPIFLRWDKHNSVTENPVNPDSVISSDDFDREMMSLVDRESEKSSDWWRRIGCAVVKDRGVLISTCNRHLPSEHAPYTNGDPRNNFHKGVHSELGTSIHAEAGAIASAAKEGVRLDGSHMYVTTFPCPPCAKLIASSGIRKLFYRVGYGMLDGESVLRQSGVEIVRVE